MKQQKIVIILLLCSLLALAGCSQQDSSQAKAGDTQKTVAVQTAVPERRDLEARLTYPCQIRPAKQVYVTSKLAGKVSAVFYDISDRVNAGDILFTLDTIDIANNIKTLQAQIATAEAAVRSAQTGVSLATGSQLQSQILQASGGVQQAKTGMEQAKIAYEQTAIGLSNAEQTLEQARLAYADLQKDYQSTKKLYEIGEVTKRQLEQLELGLEQAQIRVAQAELGLGQAELARNQAKVAMEQAEKSHTQAESSYDIVYKDVPVESLQRAEDALNQAMAQRNALVAQLETAQSTLNDATVRSPISGVISARAVEAGMMLGQTTVAFTVIEMDTVYATINVSENLIKTLSLGQGVDVKIASLQDKALQGQVEIISPAASQGAAAFEVRIALPNSDSRIKPGMYAEVSLVKERQQQVLVIPRSAVLEDMETSYIYVVAGGVAHKKTVTTGIESGNDIAILSGLEDGDQVVVKGQKSLTEGAAVNIISTIA